MAYGAVRCLELTIERLLKSSHISIVPNSSPQIINLLYDEILSLKAALEEFDARRSSLNMKMVKTLEAEMIDAVYQFEDVLDPHLCNQFHSQSQQQETTDDDDDDDHPPLMLLLVDVQEIKQDVDSFIETLNKMKRAYMHELYNPSPEEEEEEEEKEEEEEEEEEEKEEEEEEDDAAPSRIGIGGNDQSSNMVGLSHLFMRIKYRLMLPRPEMMFTSLVGMAGIGKTTLAKKLCQDPVIVSRFSTRVFVTIGPKYRLEDVLLDITRCLLIADINQPMLILAGALALAELMELGLSLLQGLQRLLGEILENRSCLIVLDDVWDIEPFRRLFPDGNNGNRILVTSRTINVTSSSSAFEIPFLDKKESWDLLRDKVFGDEHCSYAFEKAGRKIAKNCEGLPLTIVTIAKIISKADNMTLEYWNEVADDEHNSVYKDAYDQMSKVLYPSYDYLQQHLKACFLYTATFPQNYPLHPNSLTRLWIAEGFLNPTIPIDTTNVGCFNQLCLKSVIQFLDNTETSQHRLHTSFWYLCVKEAAKTKLFYTLNCVADALPEEDIIKYQRRLCIRNSILFAIRDAHDSIASASRVRSLLCTGSDSKYPVPLCLEHLRLLRVFDARSIRFYEFPIEVVKLIQLRYIGLIYDGNLPTSISKLLNLQFLIIGRHLRIAESVGNFPLYLPVEIWNMTELIYIGTRGRDLPHPCEGSLLPNLLQLVGVGPQSCTKDVLEKIPHLKELGIDIVLAPDATEPLSCFDHISNLHQLHVLGCEIVNPTFKTTLVTPVTPLSDFPSNLSYIVLSGLGYPWEEMSKISSLPNLELLILQCYAFRGSKWEVHDNEFKKLTLLDIQDTDLEHWKFVTTNSYRPEIMFVNISHCYNLKEIPLTFGGSLREVRIVECSPIAVNCFKELKQVWDAKYGNHELSLTLNVHSSLY